MSDALSSDSRFAVFTVSELDHALSQSRRVYLSGHLATPQEVMPYVDIEPNEMGISQYDSFTCDKPHVHDVNHEFNYIAEGETHVLDIDRMEEHVLPKGSVFILQPGVPYVSKHTAGTKVVFFKTPGGNDKRVIEVTDAVRTWMETPI